MSQVDADLCEHLESEEISCQLYGMRWGRLLLSREFRSMEMQVLRIWDFLFTCPSGASTQLSSAKSKSPARITKSSTESKKLYHTITKGNSSGGSGSFKGDVGVDGAKDVEHTGPVSEEEKVLLPKLVACTLDSSSNKAAADGKIDMSSLKWTPLPWDSILAPLQFVMVAMLVTIRTELLDSDNNMLMALLMRYPDTGDVNKILNLAHQMSLGLVRIDPKVVIKRQKKRDIMFKNFQMIGSKVSKSIRRNTTVASSTSQSAPGTPLLDETHHTNASVPKTSPRAGLAEHTSAPASEPGFEMEMNTGLFSPSIPMKKPTKKEESKAMLAYKKIVSLLTAEGEALLSAASLAEIYTNRVKCYDDVYQESSSSDEDITNKDVVRKKAEPPPPPTFDRSSISNRLRGLADVIDGKITLEQYENGIADNGYKIRDLALLNAATSNTTS